MFTSLLHIRVIPILQCSGCTDCDNRLNASLTSAPLVHLLKRFESVEPFRTTTESSNWDEVRRSINDFMYM